MSSREVDDNEQPIRAPIYIEANSVCGVCRTRRCAYRTVQGRPRLIIWSRLSKGREAVIGPVTGDVVRQSTRRQLPGNWRSRRSARQRWRFWRSSAKRDERLGCRGYAVQPRCGGASASNMDVVGEGPRRAGIDVEEHCGGVCPCILRSLLPVMTTSLTLARLASANSTCRPRSDTCEAVVRARWLRVRTSSRVGPA
jgi:hypothetical protein